MRPKDAYEWLRTHPYVGDTAIVLAILLPSQVGPFASGSPNTVSLIVELLLVGPLIWRRRFPVAVFTAVSLVCCLQLVLGVRPLTSDVALLVALYTINAYARGRSVRLAALGVGMLGALLATIAWWWGGLRPWETYEYRLGEWYQAFFPLFLLIALVGFAWTLGDLMRTRRAYVAELEERARRLELERDQQARLARTAERARIARELHDIVAHSLSIVVAQADGGRYAGERDPAAALRSLDTIGTTGRDALAEMRRLLGVLRTADTQTDDASDADAGVAWAPQPGLEEVETLVGRVRASGLPVTLEIGGSGQPLPKGPGLAAYRIVQEALTNVVKHAGPTASVRVALRYEPDALRVDVVDDGRGAAASPPDGNGQGIVGMRERVAVYGGTLTAAPAPGGGFEVSALLPMPESEGL